MTLSTTPASSPASTTRPQLILPMAHLGEGPSTLRHDEHRHHPTQAVGHDGDAIGHDPVGVVHEQVEVIEAGREREGSLPHIVAYRLQRPRLPGGPVAGDGDRVRVIHPEADEEAVAADGGHEWRLRHGGRGARPPPAAAGTPTEGPETPPPAPLL